MKKILKFVSLLILMLCLLSLVACENNDGDTPNSGTIYSTVKINYHYEYGVTIEHYYQETYSVVSGVSYEIDITYTPPIKLGYKFLGWTLSSGGDGDLISSQLTGVSVGSGTTYNLFAKYEIITYNVVYHLNDGKNNSDNPTELSGTKSLLSPTRDGYVFGGWYLDSDFTNRTTILQMRDNDETTLHLYAKWLGIYTITYKSNIDNLPVEGDKSHTQYIEDYLYEFDINLGVEHFEHYLFLGWTYEGQDKPVKSVNLEIPLGYNKDLVFVANYMKATSSNDYPGLEVTIGFNDINYVVPEDFDGEIIVPDIAGKGPYAEIPVTVVYISYYGDEPPTVIAGDDVEIHFQKLS